MQMSSDTDSSGNVPRSLRVLFYGTYPNQPIGYGKIANILSNYLASQDLDVYYCGISNYPEMAVERFIDPRIKFIDVLAEEKRRGSAELYAVDIIEGIVDQIKPDVVFLYNDIIVISRLLLELANKGMKEKIGYKMIVYLDLVYEYERVDFVRHVDRNTDAIIVFSECWKKNMMNMGVAEDKLYVMHHGFNEGMFTRIDKRDARRKIGLGEDDFIVLNINRNSYRKAHDISIRAFLMFYKANGCNKKIKMFLNSHLETADGYNLLRVIETECVRLGLSYEEVIMNAILRPANRPGYVEDDYINSLYNACDVGINTCFGEGFGLCNMEHAAMGAPQIVNGVGALKDIFSAGWSYVVEPAAILQIANHMDGHGGDLAVCRAEDVAEGLQHYYDNPDGRAEDGEQISAYIRKKYNWRRILSEFARDFNKIVWRETQAF